METFRNLSTIGLFVSSATDSLYYITGVNALKFFSLLTRNLSVAVLSSHMAKVKHINPEKILHIRLLK